MDFDLPEELCTLKDSVASFCETEITPRREAYEQSGEFPHPLISKMGEAGFLAVSVISEEISRLAPEFGYAMNMQAMTCPYTIYNWGTDDQAKRFVPDLISGTKIGMFALSEAGGGSDPAGAMRTTARREGKDALGIKDATRHMMRNRLAGKI